MATRLLRRRLAAAGVLSAGLLSGCQSGAGQFGHSGVARGDSSGTTPTSPAFARVNAGRNLPATPAGGGMMMASSETVQPMMVSSNPTAMTGSPIVGSGGMVYPAGYTPAGSAPMSAPTTMSMPVQSMPVQSMPMQVQSMPMPVQTMQTMQTMTMPAAAMPSQPMPFQTGAMMPAAMPVMTPTTGMAGTPTLMLIQGPNGPQYVINEVISSMPLPATAATAVPLPPTYAMSTPVMAAPVMPAPVMPAPAPAPTPMIAPAAIPAAAPAPAPEPPPAAPTFTAPPPAVVPMPTMPVTDSGRKSPDLLPKVVSMKPPVADSAVTPAGGPTLPPTTGAVDDDISPAPVFLQAGK